MKYSTSASSVSTPRILDALAILNKMRKLLRENGQSTALADQALASYESQKSSTYNSLKSQLLG